MFMKLKLQVLDVDYFLNTNKPVVRIFGRTESSRAVCVCVDDFEPYFYVKASYMEVARFYADNPEIKKIEEVERFMPLGYHPKPTKMLKITCTSPQNVPQLREEILASGFAESVYEADILFKYRFMVDHAIKGMNWIEADANGVSTDIINVATFHTTSDKIRPLNIKTDSKLKYMSFDIETLSADPTKEINPKTDKIIIISISFSPEFKGKKTLVLAAKKILAPDAEGHEDEKQILQRFVDILQQYDPDIVTGYNINTFDLPFLIERLSVNNIPRMLGRVKDKMVFIKRFNNSVQCDIAGRVVVDPYQILKLDPNIRFSRYTLNNVSAEMLGDKKEDVAYKEIPKLWDGKRKDILRLIEYARKDSELNLRLLMEKGLLDKFIELSKISGVLLQDSLGGQTARIETMILHAFRDLKFVLPPKPSSIGVKKRTDDRESKGLKGAIVLEPEKGLHTKGCVLIFDFLSLYPSLMRTYNISPDTLLLEDMDVKKNQSPLGDYFVDASVREGILPRLLRELMDARKATKKEMKKAINEDFKRVLNARQLALKILANSYYGYTGYSRARLYTMAVAGAITSYGRENIERTKKTVEENYPVEVIYGDTDSIFLKTKITDMNEAKKFGDSVSKHVTGKLPGVLELEFEKIYRTMLILTKKRYAGWRFDATDDGWKDSVEMKGIETIRRDWCPLVSETMNSVIKAILIEGDIQKSIGIVKDVLKDIKNNKVPLEKLTVVKGITKSLNNYAGVQPHVELAKKLNQRNPAEPVQVGDRIGYVIIKGNQLLSKRAEDPAYIKEHKLQIDSDYYIMNQLLPPIQRILNSLGISQSELLGGGHQFNLMDIVNGKKRVMKHEIPVSKKQEVKALSSWEEFICCSCHKSYTSFPLRGICECGGELKFGYQGNTGESVSKA